MCGIVGYIGKANAATVLIGGLKQLEYRSYDSAGLAHPLVATIPATVAL